jgi:DNA-binding transcriptional LysR family regulator
MDLSAVDLNLLRVFDAVFQERHVTRAAARLALTQPALSNALARLRRLLKDELFVKTPAGVRPTDRAQRLAGPVRDALALIEAALAPERFTPESSTRVFRIAITDYAAAALLPNVTDRLQREAPQVALRMTPYQSERVLLDLERGEIDLGVGGFARSLDRFETFDLLRESPLLAVSKSCRFAGQTRLSLEDYAALRHMLVSPFGEASGYIDEKLAALGRTRSVNLTVNQFLLAMRLVAPGDLAVILPQSLALEAAREHDLKLFVPPAELAAIELVTQMIWMRARSADPAHAWLRAAFQTAADAAREARLNPAMS